MPATPERRTPEQTLIGFDYGHRRIGVAVGQRVTGTATALQVLAARGEQPDWAGISAIIAEWQPQALVVGLPLLADGREGDSAAAARRFAQQLGTRFRLPVYLVDERLSSWAAQTSPNSTSTLDAEAARVILETWLREHDE